MTDHINDRPDEQDKHFGDEDAFAADQPLNEDAVHDVSQGETFINDSAPDLDDAPGFAEDTTTFTDDATRAAEDAAEPPHDAVDGTEDRADQLGQNLRKAAEDTAYAAVGFVGLVSEKAKAFYEDQKKQYADAHPEADAEHGAKNFLAQLREQLDKFIDEVNRSFRDLSERGRATAKDEEFVAKAERFAEDVEHAAEQDADVIVDDPASDVANDKQV